MTDVIDQAVPQSPIPEKVLAFDLLNLTIGEVTTMEQVAGQPIAVILEAARRNQATFGILAACLWLAEHRADPSVTPEQIMARPAIEIVNVRLVTPEEAADPTPGAGFTA